MCVRTWSPAAAQNVLNDSELYRLLRRLDEEMAEEARRRGCPCGGKLHRADYPRQPRGGPPELEDWQRLSFCCAEEGCRRRTTPPSALFLGRKVYFGAVVVLASVLRQGLSPSRLSRLRESIGVSARTVQRWRKWWLEDFVRSDFWKAARGRLRLPLEPSQLPLSLLEVFEASSVQLKLMLLLRFVSPLTTSSSAAFHLAF